MNALRQWWQSVMSKEKDRRKTDRIQDPKLSVYYWTGARPERQEVRDISPTGMYVLTDERWYPGTVVKMTLQTEDGTERTLDSHIAVESKVVRTGEDGVGVSFVLLDDEEDSDDKNAVTVVRDKRSMKKFLQSLFKESE